MPDDLFWCEVCGKNDDAPHTPIDHPGLLRGHRLIPKPKVNEMIAEAVAAERARIRAAVEGLPMYEQGYLVRAAVLAIIDEG